MHEEWTNAWFSEAEALAWRNAGFTLKQALVFREAKITVEQAITLREHQGSLDAQPNKVMQRAEGVLSKIGHKVAGTINAHPKLVGVTSGIVFFILLMVEIVGSNSNRSNSSIRACPTNP